MKWPAFLRPSNEILRPIEIQILLTAAEQLSPRARERFLIQVGAVNKVQRHTSDREVNLYHVEAGKATFDDTLRFPMKLPEARLATVWLRVPDVDGRLRAEIWLANGRVFSITFDRSPTQQSHRRTEIERVQVWLDPMEVAEEATGPKDQSMLRVWLGPRSATHALANVLSVGERAPLEEQLSAWDTVFPADVRALFEITGGFQLGNAEVHGVASLRSIVLDDGEFIVLAESANGKVLALKRYESSGFLYLMDAEQATSRRVSDFRMGLEELLAPE